MADLPVALVHAERNGGFAYGSNLGAAQGAAPYVLLLNPDATLAPADLAALVAVLDAEPATGLVAPRIEDEDGVLHRSQRRFPRLRSALVARRCSCTAWPRCAAWSDDLVHDAAAYERPGTAEWVSGACLLVRRSALEALGGPRRGLLPLQRGHGPVRPAVGRGPARALRARRPRRARGRASAPRSGLRVADVRSHVRYVLKHDGARAARLAALAQALEEVTHLVARARRPGWAAGHRAGLAAALGAARAPAPRGRAGGPAAVAEEPAGADAGGRGGRGGRGHVGPGSGRGRAGRERRPGRVAQRGRGGRPRRRRAPRPGGP